jgi:hypothetical protein
VLVGGLDGSDDLLILKMKLITSYPELALSQGEVDILREKLHCFGHHEFKIVKSMEGDSCNL